MLDAVVVGAGPNGLTAAVELARRGFSVALFEAKETVGGGARTEELTLPGFRHDPCSAPCRGSAKAWSGSTPNCRWRPPSPTAAPPYWPAPSPRRRPRSDRAT